MALVGAIRQSMTFYDAKQQSTRMSLFIGNAGVIADIEADGLAIARDVALLSNTSIAGNSAARSVGAYTSNPVPVAPGASSTYEDVADKAVFVFQDASGGLHRYQIACPRSAIFLADQETVDFTVAAVKQFVADMTATTFAGTANTTVNPVVTRSTVPLTASVGGYRRRGKTPRKFNIYTRNPALTGQGE